MSVQIIINGADANESIRELSALAAAIGGGVQAAAPQAEPEKPKRQPRTKPEPQAEPEQIEQPENSVATQSEEPPADPKPGENDGDQTEGGELEGGDSAEPPSVEKLREVAQAKASSAGKEKIKALLEKFESASVTAVPKEKRAAFLAELEKL